VHWDGACAIADLSRLTIWLTRKQTYKETQEMLEVSYQRYSGQCPLRVTS
jgi:hypothetical protein